MYRRGPSLGWARRPAHWSHKSWSTCCSKSKHKSWPRVPMGRKLSEAPGAKGPLYEEYVARQSKTPESMFVSRLEISSLKVRPSSFSHVNEQICKLAVSRKPSSWTIQNEIKIVSESPEAALSHRAANSDLVTKHWFRGFTLPSHTCARITMLIFQQQVSTCNTPDYHDYQSLWHRVLTYPSVCSSHLCSSPCRHVHALAAVIS